MWPIPFTAFVLKSIKKDLFSVIEVFDWVMFHARKPLQEVFIFTTLTKKLVTPLGWREETAIEKETRFDEAYFNQANFNYTDITLFDIGLPWESPTPIPSRRVENLIKKYSYLPFQAVLTYWFIPSVWIEPMSISFELDIRGLFVTRFNYFQIIWSHFSVKPVRSLNGFENYPDILSYFFNTLHIFEFFKRAYHEISAAVEQQSFPIHDFLLRQEKYKQKSAISACATRHRWHLHLLLS